jgi:hypothetical protein
MRGQRRRGFAGPWNGGVRDGLPASRSRTSNKQRCREDRGLGSLASGRADLGPAVQDGRLLTVFRQRSRFFYPRECGYRRKGSAHVFSWQGCRWCSLHDACRPASGRGMAGAGSPRRFLIATTACRAVSRSGAFASARWAFRHDRPAVDSHRLRPFGSGVDGAEKSGTPSFAQVLPMKMVGPAGFRRVENGWFSCGR